MSSSTAARRQRVLCLLLALMVLGAAPAPGQQRTGYEGLRRWTDLPRAKTAVTAGLASSFDRSGGNQDFNNYQDPPGHQTGDVDPVTLLTLIGPGVLTRFWMLHATANAAFPVRITIDSELVIDTDSDTLLGGAFGYLQSPLVQTLIGGQVSYEPIPFQQSVTVESANYADGEIRSRHYYQWSYRQLGAGAVVPSFSGTLTVLQQAARSEVVGTIDDVGSNPAGPSPTATTITHGFSSVDPGSSLVLADVVGSGAIRRLSLRLDDASDHQLDGLRLQVRYDGSADAAIDAPISHFFGAGHGRVSYASLPLGTDDPDGLYCYWPMPYRTAVSVELFNDTAVPIPFDTAEVEYETRIVLPDEGSLHAVYSEQLTASDQEHHLLLAASGQGHYVGTLLFVEDDAGIVTILEGDDIITVDGTRVLNGTGLEDAYNGGYYYNHAYEQSDDGDLPDPDYGVGPMHGLLAIRFPDLGHSDVRCDQYRWLLVDPIPFTSSIEVKIENHGRRENVLFGSTAFFYLLPETFIAVDDFEWGDLGGWSTPAPSRADRATS